MYEKLCYLVYTPAVKPASWMMIEEWCVANKANKQDKIANKANKLNPWFALLAVILVQMQLKIQTSYFCSCLFVWVALFA